MHEASWSVDWRSARARAPEQGRSLLRRDRSEMHCERVALTAGLALCQVEGHCDRPMTFAAPAAEEPRAHWQFLAAGAGELVDARGAFCLRPEIPTLFTPPAGGVAWHLPRRGSVHVLSLDVTASALAHWCDSRQAHAFVFDARREPVAFESGAQRASYSQLRTLASVDCERSSLWRLRCEVLVLQVLASSLERLGLGPARGCIGSSDLAKLRRARECLEDSPTPPITLPALARAIGMPVRRLQRLYERRYGESLRVALQRARFEAARRALLDGAAPIKQIALRAGFAHATSFTHAFKAYWGYPPSELTSRRSPRRAACDARSAAQTKRPA